MSLPNGTNKLPILLPSHQVLSHRGFLCRSRINSLNRSRGREAIGSWLVEVGLKLDGRESLLGLRHLCVAESD
jgi:hypothetical protein